MKKLVLIALLAVSPFAFAKKATTTATADSFKLIHTDDLAKLIDTAPTNTYIVDANNDKTRTTEGVIPGAHILTSYDKYNVATELPADKTTKLVFYCANTQCSASHDAANRAAKAGYKDVNVMADGIQGWKKAGKTADKYTKPTT